MKATIDIPDELFRQVKARSAMQGRPLRAVTIELFQGWMASPVESQNDSVPAPSFKDEPWLAITRPYVKPGLSHDLDDISSSAAKAWASEIATDGTNPKTGS